MTLVRAIAVVTYDDANTPPRVQTIELAVIGDTETPFLFTTEEIEVCTRFARTLGATPDGLHMDSAALKMLATRADELPHPDGQRYGRDSGAVEPH